MKNLVYILNGPNLNLLGKRQTDIYGSKNLKDVEQLCDDLAAKNGYDIFFGQTNAEHELINWIHEAREKACAIIINPAGYSHTSVAILDALHAFEGPVAEVHISDIKAREKFNPALQTTNTIKNIFDKNYKSNLEDSVKVMEIIFAIKASSLNNGIIKLPMKNKYYNLNFNFA